MNILFNRAACSRTAVLLALLSCPILVQAQSETPQDRSGWEFLPSGTLVAPLVANPKEARVGVRKEIGSSQLKLDIGSAVDLVQWSLNATGTSRVRAGADFFTYALTTSSEGLRLQVDAVDGFFGGHIAWRLDEDAHAYIVRLRVIHLSAHLIDGHFDINSMEWKDGRLPLPFTRDAGELVGAFVFPIGCAECRVYSGANYATKVRPSDVQRWEFIHGVECNSGPLLGPAMGKPCEVYAACNVTLAGVPSYVGTTVAEGGIKFGAWDTKGIKLYVNYASGMSFFSQYYNVRRTKWGAGFTIDFW